MKTYKIPECELLRTVKAHESPVIVMTIDPTSTLVATGGAEGSVKVWDIEGGFTTHNFRGHAGMISALKFWGYQGSSQWLLASASDQDNKIRVWDLVKRKSIASFENHDSVVRGLDFTIDGNTLISGGRDKVINVWDMTRLKLVTTIPVMDTVETAGFLKPGVLTDDETEQIIYAGGEKGETSLWSLKKMKRVALCPHRQKNTTEETVITEIIYKPEVDLFIPVLSDETLLQLSLDTMDLTVIRRIAGNHGQIIDCAFVGEDNTHLAIATNSPEVRIIKRDSLSHSVLAAHSGIVMSIDRSLDGYWLATASKDKQARLWDLRGILDDGKDIMEDSYAVFSGHIDSVGAIALPRVPNLPGKENLPPSFVITGSQDLTVKRWSVPQRKGDIAKALYTRKAHDKDINAIDVSPDNRMFATASQDRTAKIWDLETGEVIAKLSGHKRGVWCVKFNPYDKFVATGSGDMDVKIWSLNDFSAVKTFQGHTNSILKLAFLTSGEQIASAGADNLVKVWEIKSGECNTTLDYHKEKVWSLAVSDDDKTLVSGGGDGVITFWSDVTEEKILQEQDLQNTLLLKQQELDNYVATKDWKNAIVLALSLDQPYQVLKLFSQVLENNADPESITGLVAVDQAIATLNDDALLAKLLMRIRNWNTNGQTAMVAQTILHAILCYYDVEKLCALDGVSGLVEGLIPYSERHLSRTNELIEESFMVDYVLQAMEKV